MGVDPLAHKFPSHSPYNYTLNNPINMIDPDGRAPEAITPETVWDVINVAMGAASFGGNVAAGNWGKAAVDGLGLAYDAFATAVPVLPAGGSTAIGVYRLSNLTKKALGSVDAARTLFKGNKNFQGLNSKLKKAYSAIDEQTDIRTLTGAIKEKLGIPLEVIKQEAKDGKFNHTQKIEQGINSMRNAVGEIDKVLDAGNLSKKQSNVLKNTRELLNTRSDKLQGILNQADEVAKKLE